jgi:hypothetical protein
VLVGKPVAENPDGLDPALAGRRPKRGRDVLCVTDDIAPDHRLSDVCGVIDRGPRRGARITRRSVDVALLEADLAQCRGPNPEPVSRRSGDVRPAGLGNSGVEVTVG